MFGGHKDLGCVVNAYGLVAGGVQDQQSSAKMFDRTCQCCMRNIIDKGLADPKRTPAKRDFGNALINDFGDGGFEIMGHMGRVKRGTNGDHGLDAFHVGGGL